MRIFTVDRESGSSLKSKTKPVCTRSSRSRIAYAVSFVTVLPLRWFRRSSAQVAGSAQTLCQPQVVGNRRIPKESVLARLFSHQGDLYDPQVVERDFNSLVEHGLLRRRPDRACRHADKCVQLVIYVREKPTIREINYKGLNAVSQSDVLERFKKAKVGLSVESQYDPTKIKTAEVVLKELLAEHGHQFATIKTEVKTIPPAAVALTFTSRKARPSRSARSPSTATTMFLIATLRGGDEEPEADRHPALDHPGEPVCAYLRRQQAGRRHRARSPGLSRPRLLQGARPASRQPTFATLAA